MNIPLHLQRKGDLMEQYLSLIRAAHLFHGIDEKDTLKLLRCLNSTVHKYKHGEYIFRAGQRLTLFAILLEGRVYIQNDDYWGNRSILNELSAGEVFGESYAVVSEETQEAPPLLNDVVAVTDCSVLFSDTERVFFPCETACACHSVLLLNLFSVLAERNRLLTEKLGHMSKRTTREKLLSYLSCRQALTGSSSFRIPFNRQQLADFLSVDRSAMSNELCKMRNEGILDFCRSDFTLKNPHEFTEDSE